MWMKMFEKKEEWWYTFDNEKNVYRLKKMNTEDKLKEINV